MSTWFVASLAAGLALNLVNLALALAPVQAALRLRARVAPGKATGWLDVHAAAAWQLEVRYAGFWLAGSGSLSVQALTWRLRLRALAGLGPFLLFGPRRLFWRATGLRQPLPGPAGLAERIPGLLRRLIRRFVARLRRPGVGLAALQALAATLRPRTGCRRLHGQLEVGFADAMATALAAAALQSALLASLARAGVGPSAMPGGWRVVPRFGQPAGTLRVDAAGAVRALWLMLAVTRALWTVVRAPPQKAATQPRPGLLRVSSPRAGFPALPFWRLLRRLRRPHRARASRALA